MTLHEISCIINIVKRYIWQIADKPNNKKNLSEKGGNMEVMTDLQFITILEMVDMILDGCENIEEAKKKVEKLIEQRKDKKEKNE